tara:strand:- start:418 stop:624 length:207 start_codon:yes stop_codon:yes gene_type:complete
MNPKEKAKNIVETYKYRDVRGLTIERMSLSLAKQCALICVDEVIDDRSKRGKINFTYWKEVEKEINKL